MHFVYLDESGNTGRNLNDSAQPVFVLAALVVDEAVWQPLEAGLSQRVNHYFPDNRPADFEMHAVALRNGVGYFRQFDVSHRLDFIDSCLGLALELQLKLVYRAITKRRFATWIHAVLGSGVSLNLHIAGFPLVARVVDDYLLSKGDGVRGIFISDENREIIQDVEKAIFLLRLTDCSLRLHRILEKGFFVDSKKSLVLQLCDICAFYARKKEERVIGVSPSTKDDKRIELIEQLTHKGNEAWGDTMAWIVEQQKKERPGE